MFTFVGGASRGHLCDSTAFLLSTLFAGSTLLQYTVYLIVNDGVIRADGMSMQERIPFMDRDPQATVTAAKMKSPRLLRTHMPYGLLPAAIEAGHGKVKCNCPVIHSPITGINLLMHKVAQRFGATLA